jgi:hypothetical protein
MRNSVILAAPLAPKRKKRVSEDKKQDDTK